jgi:transposase InsO family protein
VKLDPFIEAEEAAGHGVKHCCDMFQVSRTAYYQRKQQIPSDREVSDRGLLEKIRQIHDDSDGTYGSPRVHQELLHLGVVCGRRRVRRLMRLHGLEGRCKKRWRTTTIQDPAAEAEALDLIQRHFGPGEILDARYVGDITYLATWEGWAYLATVIDLASRKVVGWALSDHMRTELISDPLLMAFGNRRPPAGLIFHSDRGCQYTSRDFRQLASDHGVVLSLGRKGDCWDKAMASYCTPLRWLGWKSFVVWDSLAFDQERVAGCGRVEEADVLVVGLMGGEQAGLVPGLDGGGGNAELLGQFGDGEQTV